MDIRKVKKLIELLEESGVTEIEVCEGEESVRISRQITAAAPVQSMLQVPQAQAPVTSSDPAATANVETEATEPEVSGHVIKSPMVGIFYAAPSPEAAPFVQVGHKVGKGEVLCLVEAMKIMNQIEADIDGEVARIHVENGEPIEYGQPLFTLR